MIGGTLDPSVVSALNGNAGSTGARDAGGGNTMSSAEELRENFLKLLITQLKHQDPLNPLENNELTTQLAQINTVTGIDALNETMKSITGQLEAGQSLQAANLIGQGVLVPGERVLLGEEGTATPFGVELEGRAASLTARITNSAGQVVRRIELGAVNEGASMFQWDGMQDSGEPAAKGAYQVRFEARDSGDNAMDAKALNYALVHGVSRTDSGPLLDLGGIADQVKLDDVRKIL